MRKKLCFIINPVAGGRNKKFLAAQIQLFEDFQAFDVYIKHTEKAGDATSFSKEAADDNFEAVIVAGGDGTINEAANALINTNTALGIIPMGSGNGLARSLKVPLDVNHSLKRIAAFKFRKIDHVEINKHTTFNVSGIGFDAHTAMKFSQSTKRGFWSYVKAAIAVLLGYKPISYTLSTKAKEIKGRAFMISIANATQFGSGAKINPEGIMDDGLFDVCLLKPFPAYKTLEFIYRLFKGSLSNFSHMQYIRTDFCTLFNHSDSLAHIDGEVVTEMTEMKIQSFRKTLKVL